MKTFNNSKNFKKDVLKFIESSSPLYSQQIAVPHEEIERLMDLFNSTDNLNFEKPDIIVLEKNSSITKHSTISLDDYCLIEKFKYLDVYLNLEQKVSCKLF